MIKSVMKSRMIKSRGFSLLEIIIALSVIGIVLVSLATYARKVIDEHVRQVDAEAVAQEVYGVLQFVNADTIEIFGGNNPIVRKVTNPLYQLPGMSVYPDEKATPDAALKGMSGNPIYQLHLNDALHHSYDALYVTDDTVDPSPYIGRSFSTRITSPIANERKIKINGDRERYNHSLKWSEALWGRDSVRRYFTDSGCPGTTGNPIYFKQQYLSCSENPTLRNSEIAVARVDMVNGTGGLNRLEGTNPSNDFPSPVNRVDVYVSFRSLDGNSARLEQFITPLMTAFRARKIVPNANNVYLVMQDGANNSNAWTLLDKKNGNAATATTPVSDLAVFTDLPDMTGRLQAGHVYGLRFTFDGSGDYLRTDGLNAAIKLCWNTAAGAAGPCLTSSSPASLVLKRRDNPQEFAGLQVDSVVSTISRTNAGGNVVKEYYTAPHIQYAAFNNTGINLGPYYKGGADNKHMCTASGDCDNPPTENSVAEPANGAISIPLQSCPHVVDVDGNQVPMYPRLSAAISSVVSGINKGSGPQGKDLNPVQMVPDMFESQADAMFNLNRAGFTLNRLGGSALRVSQDTATRTWRIAGMVAAEDISDTKDRHSWLYYNPSWLSVMVSTWCSSEQQH
ncbi:TPA: type II secretion system protein [Salmonella enterica subsp. enterica serovar Stanley]|nr:type II secretion system protein [Salmonella enterica subsp. enterica serovar Stanley]